jgi:hypothetical protein
MNCSEKSWVLLTSVDPIRHVQEITIIIFKTSYLSFHSRYIEKFDFPTSKLSQDVPCTNEIISVSAYHCLERRI